ncbi:unnamed protein product, partial [Owenia fusiformis]
MQAALSPIKVITNPSKEKTRNDCVNVYTTKVHEGNVLNTSHRQNVSLSKLNSSIPKKSDYIYVVVIFSPRVKIIESKLTFVPGINCKNYYTREINWELLPNQKEAICHPLNAELLFILKNNTSIRHSVSIDTELKIGDLLQIGLKEPDEVFSEEPALKKTKFDKEINRQKPKTKLDNIQKSRFLEVLSHIDFNSFFQFQSGEQVIRLLLKLMKKNLTEFVLKDNSSDKLCQRYSEKVYSILKRKIKSQNISKHV